MLAARRMMFSAKPRLWLDCAGTGTNGGPGWSMSSMTVGYRIGGTWHNTGATPETLLALGLADAYRVQTVVATNPTGIGNYYDWFAGWGNVNGLTPYRRIGVFFETDNSTCTLYLMHPFPSAPVSNTGFTLPVAGDTVEVVSDFTAQTATASINGVTVASFSFAGEPWYTADGAAA